MRDPMTPALLLAVALSAAPKALAMPSWTVSDVKPEVAALYADQLAAALREGGFRVVTTAEIATLLTNERQRQLLGCSDESSSCLAELADAVGTDATVLVRLVELDGTYRAHLKVLSSRDGAVLAETRLEAPQPSFGAQLDGAARRLTDALRPPGPRRFAWAPGALGVAGAGAGIACLVLANARYVELQSKLMMPSDADAYAGLASEGKALQAAGWVALSVGIAALVATVALIVLGGGE